MGGGTIARRQEEGKERKAKERGNLSDKEEIERERRGETSCTSGRLLSEKF